MDKGNTILYGSDGEENIVSIEPLYGKNIVKIFKRENGRLKTRYEPYKHFCFVNENDSALNNTEGYEVKKLLGSNYYNRKISTDDTGLAFDIKYNADNVKFPYIGSQYMLQTGKTCFKGMDGDDPLILYFDLEVITKEGFEFPNSSRSEDEIVIIAIRTNRGDEWVIYQQSDISTPSDSVKFIEEKTEKEVLETFIEIFRQVDPDIVANHNIFNFDLPYLDKRCSLNNVSLNLGRNGAVPKTFDTSIKFDGSKTRDYTNYSIFGRTVIDTQFLAEYRDVVTRDMPSYRLKDLVKYLGKESDDRTYIPGEILSDVWKGNDDSFSKEDMLRYAIDDVREAEILYKEWSGTYFELSKIVPMNYQEVFRYGTGNQVEYVFMREYNRQGWSYPTPDKHRSIKGGYADVLQYGMVKGRIMYADVSSLYPSLGKILDINPYKDELGIYQTLLYKLHNLKNEIDKKENPALYSLTKIFLNTMAYGFIAFGHSSFNDYDEAERITTTGQQIMKDMVKIIEKDGGSVQKIDTDGCTMLVPEQWRDKEDEYTQRLTDELPEGIIIDNDGVYDGIMSFDKKSYALLEQDGTVKIKGNTLIGRSIEGFFTRLVEDCIKALFKGEDKKCQEYYNYWKQRIADRDLEANLVSKRKNLNMRLEDYKNNNRSGNTQTLAQYELAIEATKPYMKGDVIKYYIREYPYIKKMIYGKPEIRKKKCKNYEAAALIDDYDFDYEPDYYFDRLDTAAKKFMIMGQENFEELFDVKTYAKDKRKYKKLTGNNYEVRT